MLVNRVREATSTTGTGPLVLDGAVMRHVRFSDALNAGDMVHYCIEDGANFELGIGTLQADGTFSRDQIIETLENSVYAATGAQPIVLSGYAQVFATLTAGQIYPLGPTDSPTFAGLTVTGAADFAGNVTMQGNFLAGKVNSHQGVLAFGSVGTGANPSTFIDVHNGQHRLGAFDWTSSEWQPLSVNGTTIQISGGNNGAVTFGGDVDIAGLLEADTFDITDTGGAPRSLALVDGSNNLVVGSTGLNDLVLRAGNTVRVLEDLAVDGDLTTPSVRINNGNSHIRLTGGGVGATDTADVVFIDKFDDSARFFFQDASEGTFHHFLEAELGGNVSLLNDNVVGLTVESSGRIVIPHTRATSIVGANALNSALSIGSDTLGLHFDTNEITAFGGPLFLQSNTTEVQVGNSGSLYTLRVFGNVDLAAGQRKIQVAGIDAITFDSNQNVTVLEDLAVGGTVTLAWDQALRGTGSGGAEQDILNFGGGAEGDALYVGPSAGAFPIVFQTGGASLGRMHASTGLFAWYGDMSIDQDLIINNRLYAPDNTGEVYLSGGGFSDQGASLVLWGGAHANNPNRIAFRADGIDHTTYSPTNGWQFNAAVRATAAAGMTSDNGFVVNTHLSLDGDGVQLGISAARDIYLAPRDQYTWRWADALEYSLTDARWRFGTDLDVDGIVGADAFLVSTAGAELGLPTDGRMRFGRYAASRTDLTGLISGTAAGAVLTGADFGHVVIELRSSDIGDRFAVVADSTYNRGLSGFDTLAFSVNAVGNGAFAGAVKAQSFDLSQVPIAADDAAAATAGVAVNHIYRKSDGTLAWRQA